MSAHGVRCDRISALIARALSSRFEKRVPPALLVTSERSGTAVTATGHAAT